MALSNRDRFDRAFEVLGGYLGAYVDDHSDRRVRRPTHHSNDPLALAREVRKAPPRSSSWADEDTVRGWLSEIIKFRGAHYHWELLHAEDYLRCLDTIERLIRDLASQSSIAVVDRDGAAEVRILRMGVLREIAEERSVVLAEHEGDLTRRLAQQISIYEATGDPEDLANRQLRGALLPLALRGGLSSKELNFLLRSATWDAQRIISYARLTVGLEGVDQILLDWIRHQRIRPKYRLAACLQLWPEEARRGLVDTLSEEVVTHGCSADHLLSAIRRRGVRELIENPELSGDLSSAQREDLVKTLLDPLEPELTR